MSQASRKNPKPLKARTAPLRVLSTNIDPPRPRPRRPRRRSRLLPPELFRHIIEWVSDSEDLYHLCLASRICRFEAERVLYRSVHLPQNTLAPVLWARTILSSPQKAMAVRSLVLRFDLAFLILPHKLLPSLLLISQALGALRNLRNLRLVGHPRVRMHPGYLWLLDGCVPGLEVFDNSVFFPSDIAPFLSRHPNIRRWKQAGTSTRVEQVMGHDFLPRVTDIDVSASSLSFFTSPRPLRRIKLEMNSLGDRRTKGEREIIKHLSLFGNTLESLIIENLNLDHLAAGELLGLLADATPNLKVLSYTHLTPTHVPVSRHHSSNPATHLNFFWPFSQDYEDLIPFVQSLSKLEVLVLPSRKPASAALRLSVAQSFLNRCPSLRRLVLKGTTTYSYGRCRDSSVGEWPLRTEKPCEEVDSSLLSAPGTVVVVERYI